MKNLGEEESERFLNQLRMTQEIWRFTFYVLALHFLKEFSCFFSLRLNLPPFLSISFSSLSPVLQVNPCHKWRHMSHYKMQWEGWVISTKESPLFWNNIDPPSDVRGKPTWVTGGSCQSSLLSPQLFSPARCADTFQYLFAFLSFSLDLSVLLLGEVMQVECMHLNGWK